MSDIQTGGPAFPSGTDFYGNSTKEFGKRGLTLRDYFAAKAMQGWLASYGDDVADVNVDVNQTAAFAYKMADAMMKARQG